MRPDSKASSKSCGIRSLKAARAEAMLHPRCDGATRSPPHGAHCELCGIPCFRSENGRCWSRRTPERSGRAHSNLSVEPVRVLTACADPPLDSSANSFNAFCRSVLS